MQGNATVRQDGRQRDARAAHLRLVASGRPEAALDAVADEALEEIEGGRKSRKFVRHSRQQPGE